jgi:hypothetical protein
MLDAAVEVGPRDPCQCISKVYSLVLEPDRPSAKHGTNRMSHLSAGIVCPLVEMSPLVSIE